MSEKMKQDQIILNAIAEIMRGTDCKFSTEMIDLVESLTRASSPAQEPVITEPVALDRATKRAMFAQEDDRALPTHGQIPWKQLGRDVRDVMFGTRSDYPFDETYYPGHQIIPSMNFNSLARIVDKYRWEGIAIPAPPQPGREWLPIAEAPKDGFDFLALMHDGREPPNPFCAIVRWNNHGRGQGRWMERDGSEYHEDAEVKGYARPLGWMLLPALTGEPK